MESEEGASREAAAALDRRREQRSPAFRDRQPLYGSRATTATPGPRRDGDRLQAASRSASTACPSLHRMLARLNPSSASRVGRFRHGRPYSAAYDAPSRHVGAARRVVLGLAYDAIERRLWPAGCGCQATAAVGSASGPPRKWFCRRVGRFGVPSRREHRSRQRPPRMSRALPRKSTPDAFPYAFFSHQT